jgi:hypothetical protein
MVFPKLCKVIASQRLSLRVHNFQVYSDYSNQLIHAGFVVEDGFI